MKFGIEGVIIRLEFHFHRFGKNVGCFSTSKSIRSVDVTACMEDVSGFVSTPSSVLMAWCSTP
jgi:hypothetical protein